MNPLYLFASGLLAALAIDIHPPALVGIGALIGLSILQLRRLGWRGYAWKEAQTLIVFGFECGVLWWLFFHYWLNRTIFFDQWNSFNGIIYKGQATHGMIVSELNRYWQFFWEGKFHRNLIWLGLFTISTAWAVYDKRSNARKVVAIIAGMMLFFLFFVPNKLAYVSYTFPFFIILSAHYLRSIFDSNRPWVRNYDLLFWCSALTLLLVFENGYKIVAFRNSDFKVYCENVYDNFETVHRTWTHKNGVLKVSRWGPTFYGSSILLYGATTNRFYADHNHMWDSIIHHDQKAERLIQTLEKMKPEYLILDDGVYPYQNNPHTERAERFQIWVSQTYRVINSFEDEFYGHDWYNFKPGGKFKTTIWRRK